MMQTANSSIWKAFSIVIKIVIILYFMNSKLAFFAYQNF